MNDAQDANRRWWDEAVAVHAASAFYDVPGFEAGRSSLLAIERRELGNVAGKTLLHLQCHFGLDTLSWAREGAVVTGMDFSGAAIETARDIAVRNSIDATFVQSDLYKLGEVLDGEFDIVFTSYGVLIWLPDIAGWAAIVARYLRPGGTFYIVEGHPLAGALAEDATLENLSLTGSYFAQPEPTRWEDDGDYADPAAKFANRVTYEYGHSLGEIVTALTNAGLIIEFLHEHPECAWARLPSMERGDDGYYRLRDNDQRIPFMFSLRAHKPA